MTFKKGVVTSPNGRGLGTPNKKTTEIRESFKILIEKNLDNMTGWLEKIAAKDPEKAMRIINDLSEYIIPKLSRTELSGDIKTTSEVDISKLTSEEASQLADINRKLRQ